MGGTNFLCSVPKEKNTAKLQSCLAALIPLHRKTISRKDWIAFLLLKIFSLLSFHSSFSLLKFNPDPTECITHIGTTAQRYLWPPAAPFRGGCRSTFLSWQAPKRKFLFSKRGEGGDKAVLFWMSLQHTAASSPPCKGAKQSLVFCGWQAFPGEPQQRFLRSTLCLLLPKSNWKKILEPKIG